MTMITEQRSSDSPYLEAVMRGWTLGDGSAIRPAERCWHMVFVRVDSRNLPLVVGPWTSAGAASWGEGAEILWIKFKLGAFMPHLPTRDFLDAETALPDASSRAFWLHGSAWQYPDFENVETLIGRLVREGALVFDPVVEAALKDRPQELSPRTLRHRFLRATGMAQNHIRQIERAQRAAALLRQGISILDTIYELGYFDQPHLTRSLKRWVGFTPAQLIHKRGPVESP
jgi:hypothetical protein